MGLRLTRAERCFAFTFGLAMVKEVVGGHGKEDRAGKKLGDGKDISNELKLRVEDMTAANGRREMTGSLESDFGVAGGEERKGSLAAEKAQ